MNLHASRWVHVSRSYNTIFIHEEGKSDFVCVHSISESELNCFPCSMLWYSMRQDDESGMWRKTNDDELLDQRATNKFYVAYAAAYYNQTVADCFVVSIKLINSSLRLRSPDLLFSIGSGKQFLFISHAICWGLKRAAKLFDLIPLVN